MILKILKTKAQLRTNNTPEAIKQWSLNVINKFTNQSSSNIPEQKKEFYKKLYHQVSEIETYF